MMKTRIAFTYIYFVEPVQAYTFIFNIKNVHYNILLDTLVAKLCTRVAHLLYDGKHKRRASLLQSSREMTWKINLMQTMRWSTK